MAYYPYINGVSFPIFEIRSLANVLVETITFPLCQENGLTEDYEEDFKRVELQSGEIVDYDFKGSRIRFELDYSSFANADTILDVEKLFYYNTLPESYKIMIIPRADLKARRFEVKLDDGKYSLGVLKGGVNSQGNKNMIIRFVSKIPQGKNMQQVVIPVVIFNSYMVID